MPKVFIRLNARNIEMTKIREIYKCSICGNIVELVHPGAGELVCCGQPMGLMAEKTKDEGWEKHVPVIKRLAEGGLMVKVGSVPHPMTEDHWIEWVEMVENEQSYRQFLSSGQAPEARFETKSAVGKMVSARIYCNLHYLWRGRG